MASGFALRESLRDPDGKKHADMPVALRVALSARRRPTHPPTHCDTRPRACCTSCHRRCTCVTLDQHGAAHAARCADIRGAMPVSAGVGTAQSVKTSGARRLHLVDRSKPARLEREHGAACIAVPPVDERTVIFSNTTRTVVPERNNH
ncbi:hypothetical protein [Burkholderia vietnamiensis]|uniref:hypothetical protein n=1 Tax=Burkholderia vietnamiensis TaxID=60552 RepID=UPI0012D9EF37|nr:hypothetical protein [Burkholderia vietnamiensis]